MSQPILAQIDASIAACTSELKVHQAIVDGLTVKLTLLRDARDLFAAQPDIQRIADRLNLDVKLPAVLTIVDELSRSATIDGPKL